MEAYVKNAFLGFEVPYVDAAGAERRYLPDFIARICTPGGQRLFLIVEVTGFARDKTEKRYFMRERWLPAVNAHQQMLRTLPWHFIEITDIDRVKEQLEAEIERISAEVDGKRTQPPLASFCRARPPGSVAADCGLARRRRSRASTTQLPGTSPRPA